MFIMLTGLNDVPHVIPIANIGLIVENDDSTSSRIYLIEGRSVTLDRDEGAYVDYYTVKETPAEIYRMLPNVTPPSP